MPKSPRPTTPRPRGRPSGSRVDARPRLLDTALGLYAHQGVSATPVSAIARKAKVTPALLHYYFGNREQLVDAVIDERVMPVLGGVIGRLAGLSEAEEAIPAFVREIVAAIGANPWLPPLWVREVLTEGGLLRERLIGKIGPAVALRLRDMAATAQARGRLNRDLDPRLVVVSLIGLTVFALAAAPLWRRLFDADDVGPDDIVRHVLALLDRGLELPHASS